MRIIPLIASVGLMTSAALAQSASAPLSFEVASVKRAEGGAPAGDVPRNMDSSPGHFAMRNVPLRFALEWAYDLKDYEISGPDSIKGEERYDIIAIAPRLAEGSGPASDAQMRQMLQSLLTQRFQIKLHREAKELPVYVLTRGKGAPKVKEAAADEQTGLSGGPAGASFLHQPISRFTFLLTRRMDRPVLDRTGLKGFYDFTVDLSGLGFNGAPPAVDTELPFDTVAYGINRQGSGVFSPRLEGTRLDHVGLCGIRNRTAAPAGGRQVMRLFRWRRRFRLRLRVVSQLPVLAALFSGSLMASSFDASIFDQSLADRFFRLALDCVHKEYPNKIAHSLNSDADVKPPRQLTPAFYGCYDWHSSVHGHWLLARLTRLFPHDPLARDARVALAQSLTAANIAQEVKYLNDEGRGSFERAYGLAWLLQLAAELHEWDDPQSRQWSANLRPLEQAVTARISSWLPKLDRPIRTGEHNNTAFAMGLMLDYSRITGNAPFGKLVEARARDYYLKDRNCPLSYEPSGEDFLSPCLAEADAMRRILPQAEFVTWFNAFLPVIDLEPTRVADVTDGKLYHLAGLNLSRAWMLQGILSKLPAGDARRRPLTTLAAKLRQAGLESISADHYEGGHWLGSFAVYLESSRGTGR